MTWGEVLKSRAPLQDVRPMMEEEVANVAKEVFLDAHIQGLFDQVGISPLKADEPLHDGGEKDTHTMWATFTDVAEVARTPRTAGSGLRKLRQQKSSALCIDRRVIFRRTRSRGSRSFRFHHVPTGV